MLNTLAGIIASSGGAAAGGDYESIATVTVGAGGSSSIDFTSIPSTYQHLQVRGVFKMTTGSTSAQVRLNTDTATNYVAHLVYGDGSSASATAATSATYIEWGAGIFNSSSQSTAFVMDLLDYANTNKFKTTRTLSGTDVNGAGGGVGLSSGLWRSTSAVNAIKILTSSSTFAQYSSFALYGIKG